MDKEERFHKGEKVTWVGIWVNLALTIFKALAGILGRSQAMTADAAHSFSDICSDVVVLVSLKIAKRPVDERHPYGHGKIEAIAAVVVGGMVALVGLTILWMAVQTILGRTIRTPGVIALVAALISILVKEALFQYTVRIGKRLGSPVVMANAWHHRSDAFSSVVALVGITGARIGYPILDPLTGVAVSLFVMKVAYDIVLGAFHQLMDTSPDERILKGITRLAEKVEGVEHVHEIKARRMGQYLLVDLKLEVDPDTSVAMGHAIASEVKHEIMKNMSDVADVMIHVNPHGYHPPHRHPGTTD
ncbi:MAG TPA: cation transporter [Actinobacteria bacterium]|nr:cation transporter [Actinomycetota bacterium]